MYQYQAYLQMMEQRIRQLEDRALLAEKELRDVREELQRIKPVNIENINYKVQELTVSDLSGTLNLGLTALSDPDQLQKWIQHSEAGQERELKLENLQNNDEGDMQNG